MLHCLNLIMLCTKRREISSVCIVLSYHYHENFIDERACQSQRTKILSQNDVEATADGQE